jgi:hypothetical protein
VHRGGKVFDRKGWDTTSQVSAAGYAEHRAVATNDTSEGRALNRRIEIILVKGPSKTDPFGAREGLNHKDLVYP